MERPNVRTFDQTFEAFIESRVDVSEATLENYRTHRDRLVPLLGSRDPLTLSWQDVQEAVAALSADLSPASVRDLRRHASPGARLRGRRPEPGNG